MSEHLSTDARFEIVPALTAPDFEQTRALFSAYAASLEIDLSLQGFEAELASLPGDYAGPSGALLLAREPTGRALGCVALRPIPPDGCCEMKRLYVTPEGRGMGVGAALVDRVLAKARGVGYRIMRLDTLPGLTAALSLYRSRGFRTIAPYYESPFEGTIYLECTL